jgi:caffeoyl-CoA O-methyltransferase
MKRPKGTYFVPPQIDNYCALNSTHKESALLMEIADETKGASPDDWDMMIGPLEASLFKFLVSFTKARKVLEIGTFTGYSAVALAEILPWNGKVITFDNDPVMTKIAQQHFKIAGQIGKKIELIMGDAHENLTRQRDGSFDIAFIDADKTGYIDYYEECLRLVKRGGLIIADNTLQSSGNILRPHSDNTRAIDKFNKHVCADKDRVEVILLPVRDGITIIHKL